MADKENKIIEELLEQILENLIFNPDNWSSLHDENGFWQLYSNVYSKDNEFAIGNSARLSKPYTYSTPNENLKKRITKAVKEIKKRDEKIAKERNKTFKDKVDKYKDILESTYTDEQKSEIKKSKRISKFKRIFKKN